MESMKENDTGTDRDTFDLYTWINGSLAVSNLVISLCNFWWMEIVKLVTLILCGLLFTYFDIT